MPTEADATATATDPNPWAGAVWLNPPPHWSVEADQSLNARTAPGTDFWRHTFYGFHHDDGHAFLSEWEGDFSATLTVEGDYQQLYDQAGLMLRWAPEAWIKFGIELTDGAPHLSVVVTNGASDWSAMPMMHGGPLFLRATRLGDAVLLQYRGGGDEAWAMARLAPILDANGTGSADRMGVGPYLCSPKREGFEARFWDFAVTAPQVRELHP